MTDGRSLVQYLCGKTLIHRTALWLVPILMIGKEADEAAKLAIDAVDMAQVYTKHLPNGTSFLGLSIDKFFKTLDFICDDPDKSECVLVYNLDLLLSKLTLNDREQIWSQLYSGFPHRPRALLLMMPDSAQSLLPNKGQIEIWKANNRFIQGKINIWEESYDSAN